MVELVDGLPSKFKTLQNKISKMILYHMVVLILWYVLVIHVMTVSVKEYIIHIAQETSSLLEYMIVVIVI